MATTKKTTTRRAPKANASRANTNNAKTDTGLAARTGRTIKRQPYTSAAIATGAVTAVAATVAGLFFFRRSEKSLGEFTSGLTSRAKDGLADAGSRAKDRVSKIRDGIDDRFAADKSQTEIAEEALTLKETGKKNRKSVDPVLDDQSKVGSIAY